jgi:hypothetical protein
LVLNQQKIAEQLLPHQAALVGEGWSDEDTETVMQLATQITMTLHLMPIQVEQGETPNAPAKLRIPRTFPITFVPSSQADPDSFYFRITASSPFNQFYVYPATPSIPLEIEMAESILNAAQLANMRVLFSGGGLGTNVHAEFGTPRLICTIPSSALSGEFMVYNAATSQPIPMHGPNGPVVGNTLKYVSLD